MEPCRDCDGSPRVVPMFDRKGVGLKKRLQIR